MATAARARFGHILSRRALHSVSMRLHRTGKRIVTTNGTFDLFHGGHLYLLDRARRYGDVLIVGVNGDASVRRLKGSGRPLFPARFRAQLLALLRTVDFVHVFPEDDPRAMLRVIRPHVHVNGAEYGTACVEANVVRQHGGRLVLIPRRTRLGASSAIIKRLRKGTRA